MSLTLKQKERIRIEVLLHTDRSETRAQAAHSLGLKVEKLTAIDEGRFKEIPDGKWFAIARQLNVPLEEGPEWKIAQTKVFIYLTEQFRLCQTTSSCGLFCDIPDCGKTVAADHYAGQHPNAIRVDCSIFKSKRRLIAELARQFGVQKRRNHFELLDALIWTLNHTDHPLIILDEFGDLQYDAMLEVKALWNATIHKCAWFLMGATALKAKIERGIFQERVGFDELFSRFGARFQSCIAKDSENRTTDLMTQAALVAQLNAPQGADIQKLVVGSGYSLRRLYLEIIKQNSLCHA